MCRIAAIAVGAVISVAGQQPSTGIIPRLSPDTYEQAKTCGRSGADCAVAPYQVCPSENTRYSVRIATPFSRVASATLEGVKSGKPGRGMDRENANRWGTGVYVLPAERSASASGIMGLEIRREGRVIEPLTITVGPIAVSMPDGSSKQLARGYFAFPPDAFASASEVALVFSGSPGQTTCVIDRARLAALR